MLNIYSLTTEELIVVLSDLGETKDAQRLVHLLDEDLSNKEVIETTLQVATRSLIARGIIDVHDEGFLYEPVFRQIIDGYVHTKQRLRITKIFQDAEQVLLIYKAKTGLFVTFGLNEFVINFKAYEDGQQLMKEIEEFLAIADKPQVITQPMEIEQEILTLLQTIEDETKYEQELIANKIPTQYAGSILHDHLNLSEVHTFLVLNEEQETLHTMIATHAQEHSWVMYDRQDKLYLESYSISKLLNFLEKNYFSKE